MMSARKIVTKKGVWRNVTPANKVTADSMKTTVMVRINPWIIAGIVVWAYIVVKYGG